MYQQAANLIRDSLINILYDTATGQFHRGIDLTTGLDTGRALDTASWGAMFLLAAGEPQKAAAALQATSDYRNTSNGVLGYKPKIEGRVYESFALQQFYFPNDPDKTWKEFDFVWSEGSLGVAMAYVRLGELNAAQEIQTSMLGHAINVNGTGGLRLADQNIEQLFHNNPSTASSAWAVINQLNLEGNDIAKLFWAPQLDVPQ